MFRLCGNHVPLLIINRGFQGKIVRRFICVIGDFRLDVHACLCGICNLLILSIRFSGGIHDLLQGCGYVDTVICHMNLICGYQPNIPVNTCSGIPTGVVVGILYLHGNDVFLAVKMQVVRNVIREGYVAQILLPVIKGVSVDPNLADHLYPVKLDGDRLVLKVI